MPDLLSAVNGALHRTERHNAERALQRSSLDLLEEARKVLLLREVAAGDSHLQEVRSEFFQLFRVWRLMQARENLDAARP